MLFVCLCCLCVYVVCVYAVYAVCVNIVYVCCGCGHVMFESLSQVGKGAVAPGNHSVSRCPS